MNEALPAAPAAEEAVIGACLYGTEFVLRAAEAVKVSDFMDARYRSVFAVMLEMAHGGREVDIAGVAIESATRGSDVDLGLLAALSDEISSPQMVEQYAKPMREAAVRREYFHLFNALRDRVMGYGERPGEDSLDKLAAEIESGVMGLRRDEKAGDCEPVAKTVIAVAAQLDNQLRTRGQILGQSTGFEDIDRRAGGMRKSHLIILGARPAMGKSALALQIAHAVAKDGKVVLIFSFEMPKDELATRLACSIAEVDSGAFSRGTLSDGEVYRVAQALQQIKRLPIHIQDSGELTTMDLRARARRIESEHGPLGLVVVDYLQMMYGVQGKRDINRAEELGKIARQLHVMGTERKCPVLALSQLSRQVEQRESKRPQLSDLRESGSIEAEANQVWLLFREGYYASDKPGMKPGEARDDTAEVIIAKNRGGQTGVVKLGWAGRFTKFSDWSDEDEYDSSGYR